MRLLVWSCVICWGIAGVAAGQSQETNAGPASGTFGYAPGGPGAASSNAMPSNPMPSNPIFDAIDTDGDGTLTSRELRKAVVALKRFDVDKDGKITRAETLNNQVAMPTSNMPTGTGRTSRFGNGAGSFSGDPRPGAPNMLQYDSNGDGRLTADEVPTKLRGMLRGADQDGNGQLDPAEVLSFQQRMNERVRGDRTMPPGVSVGPQGVNGLPKKP